MRVQGKPPALASAPHPHGYGAQFILLDLTGGPAHDLRLAAVDAIAELNPGIPGTASRRPTESHVSVVTIPAPSLPIPALEKPTEVGLSGWAAITASGDLNLRISPQVHYLDVPREGPKTHTVAFLVAQDVSGSLARVNHEYQSAVGQGTLSEAPMHLTLSMLPLGSRLSDDAEAKIGELARAAPPVSDGRLVFSGRYGAVFASRPLGRRYDACP